MGISSLAGLLSMRGQASYCASKAGFNSYLDSARIELRHKGIRFTKIMPGFIKTEIVDDMEKFPFCISAEQAAGEIARHVERGSEQGIVPAYPWRLLAPALARLPERFVTRIMG